jgi:hypothetical protein
MIIAYFTIVFEKWKVDIFLIVIHQKFFDPEPGIKSVKPPVNKEFPTINPPQNLP